MDFPNALTQTKGRGNDKREVLGDFEPIEIRSYSYKSVSLVTDSPWLTHRSHRADNTPAALA